jgi:hypothetical protein
MAQFRKTDWKRVEQDYSAFWNHELDRPLITAYGTKDGSLENSPLHTGYTPEMSEEEIVTRARKHIENMLCFGDAFPTFWPDLGPGIVCAMVGLCSVNHVSGTTWYEPIKPTELADTHIEADFENVWFKKLERITELAIEKFGSEVLVAFSDMGGNLDLLSSLRKPEPLLMDLVDHPEEVKRVRDEFSTAWWEYFNRFAAMIARQQIGFTPWSLTWSDRPTYVLQCDFAAMISPAMFKEFVVPELQASCHKMDRSIFHLDGPAMVCHLDHLLSLEELDAVQWQPGEGAPSGNTWMELVHKILDSDKLVQLITNREQTIDAIKKYGRRNIMYLMVEQLNEHEACEFFKEIRVPI